MGRVLFVKYTSPAMNKTFKRTTSSLPCLLLHSMLVNEAASLQFEISAPLTQNMAATSDSRATYYSSTTINYLGGQAIAATTYPRSNYSTGLVVAK